MAAEVGIADAVGDVTPQDKLAHLQAAQQRGHTVAMVGDGLNDGPVLAGAHVSFAFGRAVPLAQNKADFVVLGDRLDAVACTLLQARRTLAHRAAEPVVGRALQRGVRAAGADRLVAGLAGRAGHGREFAAGGAQCRAAVARPADGRERLMDILYLLIPLSVRLVLAILGGLWWAIYRGQFEDSSTKASGFFTTIDMNQHRPLSGAWTLRVTQRKR